MELRWLVLLSTFASRHAFLFQSEIRGSSSAFKVSQLSAHRVARFDANTLAQKSFEEIDGKRVTLLKNVFFDNSEDRERWVEDFFEECKGMEVAYQVRDDSKEAGVVETYESTLGGFVERSYDSCHDSSVFLLGNAVECSLCCISLATRAFM